MIIKLGPYFIFQRPISISFKTHLNVYYIKLDHFLTVLYFVQKSYSLKNITRADLVINTAIHREFNKPYKVINIYIPL